MHTLPETTPTDQYEMSVEILAQAFMNLDLGTLAAVLERGKEIFEERLLDVPECEPVRCSCGCEIDPFESECDRCKDQRDNGRKDMDH